MRQLGSVLALLLASAPLSRSAPQDASPSPDAWFVATLWHRAADWHEAAAELTCIGNPPYFRLRLVALEEPEPWNSSGDDYLGSVRAGSGEPRTIQWARYGDSDLATRLLDADVAAYRESGEIELVVELTEGRTFRLYSPSSSEVQDEVKRFLSECAEIPTEVDRQFTHDGMRIDLEIDVNERDVEDIRAVAAELGIYDIESISVEFYGMVQPSPVAIVTSRALRNADEILQSELMMRSTVWPESYIHPDEPLVVRGVWETSAEYLRTLDRWIVRDGDFSIEVSLGPDVSYDAAERIIQAVHRESLRDAQLDHLPDWVIERFSLGSAPPPRAEQLGRWDGSVPRIERADREDDSGSGSDDERYRLFLARGVRVLVRVREDVVELLGVSTVHY